MKTLPDTTPKVKKVAVIGNPNSGKSTLFNSLTGLRQKIANYPGVTVEKKEGRIRYENGAEIVLFDLPGAYSLTPGSPDEKISVEVLLGGSTSLPRPDLVICVVDASNLERHLYLATQIIDIGVPVVVVVNMMDTAEENGIHVNTDVLARLLGVPVVSTIATTGEGTPELREVLQRDSNASRQPMRGELPEPVESRLQELSRLLQKHHGFDEPLSLHHASHLLSTDDGLAGLGFNLAAEVSGHVKGDREKLDFLDIDRKLVFVESRYARICQICREVIRSDEVTGNSISARIDRILLHRFWGVVIFLAVMGLMFQAIFTWAIEPMELIASGFDSLGTVITDIMPPGDLRALLVDGALSGVAAVVIFLPQILFLFFFIGLLEETGYMARAALMMDRAMGAVGLQGRSFIPLLGSFACAVPSIMATRTINSTRDRIVTILIAPFMSCSARIPVYTLLIAAFIPNLVLFGFLSLPGLVFLGLYLLGFGTAMLIAWIFKLTWPRDVSSAFIIELPPYRPPSLKSVLLQMRNRAGIFLKQAGTLILAVSIILWFLATYPRAESGTSSEQLKQSYAGRAGQLIEPIIKPLGFDWKIGIGLIGSLLQREVFVSTMGTIYNVADPGGDTGSLNLQAKLHGDSDPVTGKPTFTILTALCLMVYYAFAMQCMSTVAIVRRETNGWKWPLIQFSLMTAIAYGATFAVYRGGILLGIGG